MSQNKLHLLPPAEVPILVGPGKFDLMLSSHDLQEVSVVVEIEGQPKEIKARFMLSGAPDKTKPDEWMGTVHIVPQQGCHGEIRSYLLNRETRTGKIHERGRTYKLIY